MGQAELEAALRRDADDRARELWLRVEGEVERLRCEQQAQLQREEHTVTAERETEILALQAVRQAEAERQAQRYRLEAEAALAKRLRLLAESLLDTLADSGGEDLLRALAAEIPGHPWQLLQVNKRDRKLAAELFPKAAIEVSDEIIGGLVVQNEGGRIQIENTLGKRLHHLWPELLPELIETLRKEAGDHGTAD